jgi:hypothetical protein
MSHGGRRNDAEVRSQLRIEVGRDLLGGRSTLQLLKQRPFQTVVLVVNRGTGEPNSQGVPFPQEISYLSNGMSGPGVHLAQAIHCGWQTSDLCREYTS